MLAFVRGMVAETGEDYVVVDVGGVGYRIYTPESVARRLSPDEQVKLHTHLYVREDALQLFGFLSPDDLSLFELLLSVSGIGPRLALNVLGYLPLDVLCTALLKQDTRVLTKVPGIGKKTAERLHFELKDKLSHLRGPLQAAASPAASLPLEDVEQALLGLGFSGDEVLRAREFLLDNANGNEGEAELLKKAMNFLTQVREG